MDRVGKVYYRSNIHGGKAIMIINKLDGETYYRDIWGINEGLNFVLHINDDITIKELEYLFIGNQYTIEEINDAPENIKQKAVWCLFKSKVEPRS